MDPTQFVLDGKTLELPNMSASHPLTTRIEALRMFLEEKLGDDTFIHCYKVMNDVSADNDQALERLTQALSEEQRRFIPLIAQLLVCEDAFNKQSLVGR
ncbi:protein kinase [Strigomonas culicis]|uniref:Protein kinase n=1 Tax=Strigomonas culicis TaxID=28005 RepID=S9TI32_9TRYP|nr:protein kinase [Strigomonas culicis]|eukprot:EPY16534.1 protein kinase [Strigomonas culicis]